MLTCPNGHDNPRGEQLCRVCDALLIRDKTRRLSDRALWIVISTGFVVTICLAVVLGVVVTHRTTETSSAPTTADGTVMRQWWSGAREHFTELQGAIKDSRAALKRQDEAAMERSCQQMHDAGVVDLRAHLPAPDPDLTTDVDAAINDAHDAAHMCFAAISGSLNNYFGEFRSDLDQAELHLSAALDIVNKHLLTA